MKKFISYSPSSKELLRIAKMSASLPVNILVLGESGVGKMPLIYEIFPDVEEFNALILEKHIINNTIDLTRYKIIIVTNIQDIINKNEFFQKIKHIRIVATSNEFIDEYTDIFAVRLEIPILINRKEDLKELKNIYMKQACEIYRCKNIYENIKIDLSKNGKTLKESIFRNILLASMSKKEIMKLLNNLIVKELKDGNDYNALLEIFEIPLLQASKTVYKSQLQMAKNLNINRITLRKKIAKYFGG